VQLAKAVRAAPMANHPRTDVAAVVTVQANRIGAPSLAAAEASAKPFVPLPANVTAEQQRVAVQLPKLLAKATAGQLAAANGSKAAAQLAAVNAQAIAAKQLAAANAVVGALALREWQSMLQAVPLPR